VIILKIGGGKAVNVAGVAADLAAMRQPSVIVHGANAARDELAARLGLTPRVVTSASGYASVLSDERAIDLQLMAYAGLRNKRIVEALQLAGVDAVGMCGLDGRVIQGRRNRGIRVEEDGRTKVLHDHSGKPQSANVALLGALLGMGLTPVLTVPIADEAGAAINAENDDIVAVLQRELRADVVVQLIEAPGLMRDPADPGSRIDRADAAELARWEEAASGRFKRKLLALRRLVEAGAPRVVVADGRGEHPLADALAGRGTQLTPTAAAGAAAPDGEARRG